VPHRLRSTPQLAPRDNRPHPGDLVPRPSRLRRATLRLLAGSLGLLGILALTGPDAHPVHAAIPGLHWGVPEIVDSGVSGLGPSTSSAIARWNGSWFIVYARDDEVYARTRQASGWLPAVRLSDGLGSASRPVACASGNLYVFWEDESRGHREIQSRFWNGTSWSAPECVSDDELPSRRPSASGNPPLGGVCVVWEDSTASGFRARARWHVDGEWAEALTITASSADAREPVIAQLEHQAGMRIVWSDGRHGEPEIYTCAAYSPGLISGEERLTYLSGACRRPAIHAERAWIGGWAFDHVAVCFEVRPAGAPSEIHRLVYDQDNWNLMPLTAVDGSPSTDPGVSSFVCPRVTCEADMGTALDLVTWAEPVISGRSRAILAHLEGNTAHFDTLTSAALSPAFVAVEAMEPDAELLALWVESYAGTPTLVARPGLLPGCERAEIQRGPALLIAPAGDPPTILQVQNSCTGAPMADQPLKVVFYPALDLELTWDPEQEHPFVCATTDADGRATFAIRGGGCSQAGLAVASCEGDDSGEGPSWGGVRSPDVDGNCIVDLADLAYVREREGTTDFCADLNGSGRVDLFDVAIVESTLGDHCSGVAAIGDDPGDDGAAPSGSSAPALSLQAWPNPARRGVRLELVQRIPAPEHPIPPSATAQSTAVLPSSARIEIFDVGGRLVRSLPLPTPSSTVWDLLDAQGQPVPSGVYLARLRGATGNFGSISGSTSGPISGSISDTGGLPPLVRTILVTR